MVDPHSAEIRSTILWPRENTAEGEISKLAENNDKVKLLMTIPGIDVYSACAILGEIDGISRFPTREKLA